MSRLAFAKVVVVAVGCIFAGQASALTYISYTGTVGYRGQSYSADHSGVFLDVPGDLGGLPFSALLTIDTSVPDTLTNVGAVDSAFTSGSSTGRPSGVTASLTINGRTVSLTGNYLGFVVQVNRYVGAACAGCTDEIYNRVIQQNADSTHSELSFDTVTANSDLVATPEFYAPLDYDVIENGNKIAAFDIARNGATAAEGYLDVAHITISDVAPVPEPGEWAMMLGGLSLVGALARRRTQGTIT